MGEKYKLNRDAENDLNEAFDWYESEQAGVGDKFLTKVIEKLNEISKKPNKYSIYYKNVRKASVKVFPFYIIYTTKENFISIIGIWHKSRNPAKLQERMDKEEK
ncbi:MAG TPA: type II toxin-antitoxin system RelE/ParE family toxin [Leptospiraceae bacterium]|nr:type II toxin-antitoxin system RelE/ParE family toxin [Leptospiraceae bacterium]HRG77136.1 type II toxin-antitoxin system RelE/ParE family toxin [Leptospiraceae bacterium]